jgi:vacuolar-type H+-ATPase subunit E/Vma4
MQGAALNECQQRIISRVAYVDDEALLERIERLLEDYLQRDRLVPLSDGDVDAILQTLLDGE